MAQLFSGFTHVGILSSIAFCDGGTSDSLGIFNEAKKSAVTFKVLPQ